jgi:hypothetical protein
LKVPKLKEIKPEDLESKISYDPNKEKKKQNILKLKKQLEHKLWDHKMLVLKQMPYDASTLKFHDQMDMLFGGREVKKPKDWVSSKIKSKKPGRNQADEPVLSQCEIKMKENQKRRTQMLFFKRLELDGAHIIVSQQDRDLFKSFGKAQGEEQAEDDLEIAILQDKIGTHNVAEDLIIQKAAEREAALDIDANDPSSMVEKLKLKRIQQECAATQAISVDKAKSLKTRWTKNGTREKMKYDFEQKKEKFRDRMQALRKRTTLNSQTSAAS